MDLIEQTEDLLATCSNELEKAEAAFPSVDSIAAIDDTKNWNR